jgi:periplasmic protein TonB
MAGYRQSNPDRAKAAAAALLVHVLIGAAFLTGLATHVSQHPSDALRTFDVIEPPPPVEEPELDVKAAPKEEAAPPDLKAKPSPVVAAESKLPVPSPVPAAPIAGTGNATSAGASSIPGPGTGAGGTGNGLGGGGGGAGFTPARIIRKIPDSQYRRISAGRIPTGSAGILLRVNPDGRASTCRVQRTSGDPYVDAVLCDVAVRFMRFSPARDPQGKTVAQDLGYTPTWYPNR